MRAVMEIRAGEGGKDAKLFIVDMLKMYEKYFKNNNIKSSRLDVSDSEIVIEISGNIDNIIKYESGVHRLQRVPPTETKGRRQSSTITVAVLPIVESGYDISEKDIEITTKRGTGPGGQHRNTCESGVVAVHIPTGITATCTKGRSQHVNKQKAIDLLKARIIDSRNIESGNKKNKLRGKQIGRSGRGEKIRTYNFIEGRVKDERIGKSIYQLEKVMDGKLEILYSKLN